jgi:predicted RNA methylase
MRLQIKTGFYPTPPAVTDLIRTWLHFPDAPFAALDPCAGEGIALAQSLVSTAGIGYGVELDHERAWEARKHLAHVLTGDWRTVRASVAAFSLCWCNPPFLATQALLRASRAMPQGAMPGGVWE